MPTVTERDGALVRVLTFKHGLLSAVAHDLELAVERFRIEWDPVHVTATFDTRSLRVLHALVSGQPSPGALSARDREKIEQTLAEEVLCSSAHPESRFESSSVATAGDGYLVRGTLTLRGRAATTEATIRRDGGRFQTELVLDQRRFGITPYSAMLGTLKLEPEVRVRVSVPAS